MELWLMGCLDRTQKTIGVVEAFPQYSPQLGFDKYGSSSYLLRIPV